MVVFYNLDTKEIVRTEDNTLEPILPSNSTFDEKKEFYKEKNESFVSLPYELGRYINDYHLNFNDGIFVGLTPKGGI